MIGSIDWPRPWSPCSVTERRIPECIKTPWPVRMLGMKINERMRADDANAHRNDKQRIRRPAPEVQRANELNFAIDRHLHRLLQAVGRHREDRERIAASHNEIEGGGVGACEAGGEGVRYASGLVGCDHIVELGHLICQG